MNKVSLFILTAVLAAPLMGQDAKELADNLTLPALPPGATQLPLPSVPNGARIEFGGADFEQIIGKKGKIFPVISEVPVQVFFKVTKDGRTVDSKDYEVVVKPAAKDSEDANPKPATIPAILQWRGSKGEVALSGRSGGITIGAENEDAALARQLASELKTLLDVPVKVQLGDKGRLALIRLSRELGSREVLRGESHLPSRLGKEGYQLFVRSQQSLGEKSSLPENIEIVAPTPTGLFWGTRTLLQIVAQREGKVPAGIAVDFPRYSVRGCMLDIARIPYSMQSLYDLVNLMAWYKMNDLHLGINNNYIFLEHYVKDGRDPLKEAYAAFRLESNVKGKNGQPLTAQDLSYSKKEFRALINYAKARGVNIVPEFNSPAHALAFTRVRPDLIYQGPMHRNPDRRFEMLDASNPETLKFVSGVFDEYLRKDKELGRPVFEGCVVHVGSDEFFGAAEDYRKYANGILSHVIKRGYTPRIWGSLSAKKGKTPVVSKGVQMNIWSKDWMLPFAAVEQGYDIINTFDRDLYIVPFAGYYRMDRQLKAVYENWLPNKMWNEKLPAGHPQLLGATFAVWNDLCDLFYQGYGMLDIRDSVSGAMRVLCGRLWGSQPRTMPFDQHNKLAEAIGNTPAATAAWARLTPRPDSGCEWGLSGGAVVSGKCERNLAVSPSYHLTFTGVKLEKVTPGEEQVLLSGSTGVLLGVMKDGTIGFRRSDSVEFSWDAKLPVGQEVKLEIIGTLGKTRLLINGQEVEKMTLRNFLNRDEQYQNRTRNLISTFVLPLHVIGQNEDGSSPFRGVIRSINVRH